MPGDPVPLLARIGHLFMNPKVIRSFTEN